jgi:CHAT domain-containing protein
MSSSSSVITAEAALRNHPVGGPGRAWALYELAKALQNEFSTSHSFEDLESARELYSEAIEYEPDLSKKARYLNNLGIVYQNRYNQTGDASDLDAFVDCTRQATNHISNELRPAILQNYANALQSRYYQRGDLRDLDACINIYQDALSFQTASRPKVCSNLCAALTTRYRVSNAQSDLGQACKFGDEAVSSTNDQHPTRALFLDTFANALSARYAKMNSVPDLDLSISHGRAAISLAEEQGLPELPAFSVNLGGSLASRFKIYRSIADLDDAIDLFAIAEGGLNPGHPSYENLLVNKGNALRMKFEETASEEDLVLAVDSCTQAVRLKLTEPHLRAQSEAALGNSLFRKYELTGSPDILDGAVLMYKQALQRTMNAAFAAEIWHNLGTALQTRFELRGSLEDLEDALEAIETGLQSSTKKLLGHSSSLVGLGNVLVRKFERLDLPDALDRAIAVYKEALDMTPEIDRTRAGRLTCLGHALQLRFESTGSDKDFEDAVRYCRTSIEISHKEPTHNLCLVNFGNCFLRRAMREPSIHNLEHLNAAITNLQIAADEMPKDFSTRAMCLNNLGKACELRFEQTQVYEDFDNATRNYEMALKLDSAPPMLRVFAGYRGMLLTWSRNPSNAVMFIKEATNLLHMISPRLLNRADQQDNIATFSGLASTGASILLESGANAFEALQTLELGRGVMSSLLLEARINTTDLEIHYPALAKEFMALRDQLDSSPSGFVKASDIPAGPKLDMERRITASKRLNEIIDKIRSDDKTKSVFLGPSMDELQSISTSGTVVIINVSSIRSDALIVTKNRTWHYHLQDLHQADVLEQAQQYLETLEKDTPIGRKKTNKSLHSIFKWLWDAAVGPILTELSVVRKAQGWPRIWWIPVGLMSIFPIHAAGDHSGKTDRNTLDQVISSYATTIRSLSHSRRINTRRILTSSTKAVFIAMSSTPNQNDLIFADAEVTKLLSKIPDDSMTKVVFRSQACKHDVLPALQDCNIAHFSCHGIVDHLDPSNSSLLLSDWETSPLTVADINALKLTKAQLAYLSACHASSNRVLDLLDEGIHLTGAFQMAGFPQAIGTLWQVDDERSGVVSQMVWDSMLNSDGTVDFRKAAEGLHHAIRTLREQTKWVEGVRMRFPDQPIVWAPFIHIGM